MIVLIVGCGRVGSAIANSMLAEGHDVSVLDEDPEAIALLDRGQTESWEERGGRFTVGTALELDALLAALITLPVTITAQYGHPLKGSWSGERTAGSRYRSR